MENVSKKVRDYYFEIIIIYGLCGMFLVWFVVEVFIGNEDFFIVDGVI